VATSTSKSMELWKDMKPSQGITIESLASWCGAHFEGYVIGRSCNGIVERRIKEVMKHLRALVYEKRIWDSWSRYLP